MQMILPTLYIGQILSATLLVNTYREWFESKINYFIKSLRFLLGSNIYIFFENYSLPFSEHTVNFNTTNMDLIKFAYSPDKKLFFNYSEVAAIELKPMRLPILSLEIIDISSLVIYDLTDYVEKVRYVNTRCPTISEVIMAWIIQDGRVLDKSSVKARYIEEDGTEITCDIGKV